MLHKNKSRLLFLILLLSVSPVFECQQMQIFNVNTNQIVNTMIEASRVAQAVAAYVVLKYKNEVALQQIKVENLNQKNHESYQKLIDTHRNLSSKIPGAGSIYSPGLKYISELPQKSNQTRESTQQKLADSKNRREQLHPEVVAFKDRVNKFQADCKQNRMFQLMAKNVHRIVERDLSPERIPYTQIEDSSSLCIYQMGGSFGSGPYVKIQFSKDREFSEFADQVWAEQNRASIMTNIRMQVDPEFRQDLENRREMITKILVTSNQPEARLTDIVKSRLLLPHLDIEYPFKHDLLHCQDNIIEKFYYHEGQLKEELLYFKNTSSYIANFVESSYGQERRREVLKSSGLAHGCEIGEDRSTRSGFNNFTSGTSRAFKTIFLGNIWVNARDDQFNKDFLQLIEHCEKFNFDQALQILKKYDSDLMRRVYNENYQPFQKLGSTVKEVNDQFVDKMLKSLNDLEASDIVLNQINDINHSKIDPKSIKLAFETIGQAGGSEVSNKIKEVLSNHNLTESNDPQKIMQAFAAETQELKNEIFFRDFNVNLNGNESDIVNEQKISENEVSLGGSPEDPKDDKKNDEHKQKNEINAIEDILKDAKRNEDSDYAKHYEKKTGGFGGAIKDFEALPLSNIKYISTEKRVGKLPSGKIVNIRIESREGRPTLEIFNPKNQRSIKIRYN